MLLPTMPPPCNRCNAMHGHCTRMHMAACRPCNSCAQVDWERALRQSTTVYVGNLSFFTREEQIYEVFSKV